MRADVAAAAPGVEVVAMSSTTGEGLDAVRAHVVPGRTLALLGSVRRRQVDADQRPGR